MRLRRRAVGRHGDLLPGADLPVHDLEARGCPGARRRVALLAGPAAPEHEDGRRVAPADGDRDDAAGAGQTFVPEGDTGGGRDLIPDAALDQDGGEREELRDTAVVARIQALAPLADDRAHVRRRVVAGGRYR